MKKLRRYTSISHAELQTIYDLYDSGVRSPRVIQQRIASTHVTRGLITRVLKESGRPIFDISGHFFRSDPRTVPERLLTLRQRLGLSQGRAAERGDVTAAEIRRAEDPTLPVDLDLAYRITVIYGTNFLLFLKGTDYDR